MGAIWKHFKTVCKHKWIVFCECVACGIPWQGIMHDVSKFSFAEFAPSARYFQGKKTEESARKYEIAWLHHKNNNKHHWEWWIDFGENGEPIATKIPTKYVIEMVCDWIGAGKAYDKKEWTTATPLNYYRMVRKNRYFHKETETIILFLLQTIKDKGLKEFHRICRLCRKNNYYFREKPIECEQNSSIVEQEEMRKR